MRLMCQMHCGNLSVVTITVDDGKYLGHYPSCALHIVEVANLARSQNGMSIAPSPEARVIERDGLRRQMHELVEGIKERGAYTYDQQEMWERWQRRVVELDSLIRRDMNVILAGEVDERPELERGQ